MQLCHNKLVLRLWEQCELARAQAAATTFDHVNFRCALEHDTGCILNMGAQLRLFRYLLVTGQSDTVKFQII